MAIRVVIKGDEREFVDSVKSGRKKATREIRRFEQSSKSSADKILKSFKRLGAGLSLVFIGRAAGRGILSAINQASDLVEAMNLVKVTFGDATDIVTRFANRSAISIGESRGAALAMTGELGSLVKSFGFADEAAAKFSITALQVAADIGSFKNARTSEVLVAIRAALIGSSEPMLRFGADTRAAALQQFAFEEGLVDSNRQLNNQEKAMAALLKIAKDNDDALGDFERTQKDFATAVKILNAEIKNQVEAFGKELLPTAIKVVAALRVIISRLPDVGKAISESFSAENMLKPNLTAESFGKGLLNLITDGIKVVTVGLGMAGRKVGADLLTPALEALKENSTGIIDEIVKAVEDSNARIQKGFDAKGGLQELKEGFKSVEGVTFGIGMNMQEIELKQRLIGIGVMNEGLERQNQLLTEKQINNEMDSRRNELRRIQNISQRLGSDIAGILFKTRSLKDVLLSIAQTLAGNFITAFLAQAGAPISISSILGAQHGGNFRVPGKDTGKDDKLVVMKARGGEEFSATPAGGVRQGGGGGSIFDGTTFVFNSRGELDEEFLLTKFFPVANRLVARGRATMTASRLRGL